MKKKLFLTILFIFYTIVLAFSQLIEYNSLICNGNPSDGETTVLTANCNRTSSFWLQSNRMDFVPDSTHQSFVVPLNIIIVRRSDGTGNFPDTLAQEVFSDAVNLLNTHYDNLVEIDTLYNTFCFDTSLGEPHYIKSIKKVCS